MKNDVSRSSLIVCFIRSTDFSAAGVPLASRCSCLVPFQTAHPQGFYKDSNSCRIKVNRRCNDDHFPPGLYQGNTWEFPALPPSPKFV